MKTHTFLLAAGLLTAACGDSGTEGREVELVFGAAGAGKGGTGGRGGTGGVAPAGGSGGSAGTFGAPEVTALTPTSGDYGTLVSISGSSLGGSARPGSRLVIDGDEAHVIEPSSPEVQTWTEELIAFRFPFPNFGSVIVQTPEGAVVAGDFTPSWIPGPFIDLGVGSSVVASISNANEQIMAALSTLPLRIVSFQAGVVSETAAPADGVVQQSFRLYRGSDGAVHAFAVSTELPPQIIDYTATDTGWIATPTGVMISMEYRVAGGSAGATVWFRQSDGWVRARHSTTGWAVDKGPIVEPPQSGLVAYAADAAGGLYVAFSVETGDFLDDMQAPFLQRLAPEASAFGGETAAGSSTDDYLTELQLTDRGPGVVAYYCGSDVDPFGFTPNGYACFVAGNPPAGSFMVLPHTRAKPVFALSDTAAVAGYCDGDSLRLSTEEGAGSGRVVAWPCGAIDAVELDTGGVPRLLVRSGARLYSPRPRPAP